MSSPLGIVYPLTQAQQQVYDLPLHHILASFEVPGAFDLARATASITTILERHDSLRSHVDLSDGGAPAMRVVPVAQFQPRVFDLRAKCHSPEDRETVHRAWLESISILREQSLDREHFPLFSVNIFVADDTSFHVLGVFSHLIFDGKSARIFREEFTRLFLPPSSDDAPLERLQMHYSEWSLRYDRNSGGEPGSEEATRREAFWDRLLKQRVHPLPPPDIPEAESGEKSGYEALYYRLTSAQCSAIEGLAAKTGRRYSTVVIAMLVRAMSAYSASGDASVITVLDARPLAALERCIGIFTWMGVVSVHGAKSRSLDSICEAVEQSIAENVGHSPLPPVNLLAESFALLNFHSYKPPPVQPDEGEVAYESFVYDLSNIAPDSIPVEFYRDGESATLSIRFAKFVYSRETVGRFLAEVLAAVDG